MPSVQSKDASVGGAKATKLSAIASLGLLVGAATWTFLWYYSAVQMMREQCISCEEPDTRPTRQCRGCEAKINCCDSCWPRYQREVHSLVCEDQAAAMAAESKRNVLDNLDAQRFVFDMSTPTVPRPCRVCCGPSTTMCGVCSGAFYCDSIRQCAMTDWHQHTQSSCKPDLVQMQPNYDTKSTMESPLPVDLIAHVESFLSLFQWSKAVQVNHAWRNASLLPSAAPHQILSVANSVGCGSSYLGPFARRSLRQLALTKQFAGSISLPSSASLPHFSHLQDLHFDDPTHPLQRQNKVGEYLATMSSTLRHLVVPGESFGPILSLAKLTQLRHLALEQITISKELLSALSQLVLLELFLAYPLITAWFDPDDAEDEVTREERRLFKELLLVLSHLQQLTKLTLIPVFPGCGVGDDPLTMLMSEDAPIFPRVNEFAFRCSSVELEVIETLRKLGSKFPALATFNFTQLCIEEVMPEEMMGYWLKEFQSHFHAAIQSVRETLTSITLSWPFNEPLDFASHAPKTTSSKDAHLNWKRGKFTVESAASSGTLQPLRLESVNVHALGVPVIYQHPFQFEPAFVSQLTFLKRIEINFASSPILSNMTPYMIFPLVLLEHLEAISIYDFGLVKIEDALSWWDASVLPLAFMKKRDAHRSLKVVDITPSQENEPNADLWISLQILLTVLPRVDLLRCTMGQLSMESLFRIAQHRPVVWATHVDYTNGGIPPAVGETTVPSRLVHLQTLPLDQQNYLSTSDDIIGLKLRTLDECPPQRWWDRGMAYTAPKSSRPHTLSQHGLSSSLDSVSYDYTESSYTRDGRLEDIDTISLCRWQQLEFSGVCFSSVSPQIQTLDQLNSLNQLLVEFVGIWRDEIFSTTYATRDQDIKCKTDLFRLMREKHGQ